MQVQTGCVERFTARSEDGIFGFAPDLGVACFAKSAGLLDNNTSTQPSVSSSCTGNIHTKAAIVLIGLPRRRMTVSSNTSGGCLQACSLGGFWITQNNMMSMESTSLPSITCWEPLATNGVLQTRQEGEFEGITRV